MNICIGDEQKKPIEKPPLNEVVDIKLDNKNKKIDLENGVLTTDSDDSEKTKLEKDIYDLIRKINLKTEMIKKIDIKLEQFWKVLLIDRNEQEYIEYLGKINKQNENGNKN